MRHTRVHRNSGFSLVETVVVAALTISVAGITVPKLMTMLANMQMRSAVGSGSGVVQEVRMEAMKLNRYRKLRYSNLTTGAVVFSDVNDNGTPDSTETQAQMGRTMAAYSTPSAIPAIDTALLGFTPISSTSILFSPTGMPCSAVNTCGAGLVIYFTNSQTNQTPGWAAISVSPRGRVATWVWTGTDWTQ